MKLNFSKFKNEIWGQLYSYCIKRLADNPDKCDFSAGAYMIERNN